MKIYKLFAVFVLIVLIAISVHGMAKKKDDTEKPAVEEPTSTAGGDVVSSSAAPTLVIPIPNTETLELARRVANRGSGRGASEGIGSAGGNLFTRIRSTFGYDLNTRRFQLYGDGILCPFFRDNLQVLGMFKSEHADNTERRHMMEGNVNTIERAMREAGYGDFTLNREGVDIIVEHLVNAMRARQDRLYPSSPLRPDAVERVPAILDMVRWRIEILPNLGPHGHVRISQTQKPQKGAITYMIGGVRNPRSFYWNSKLRCWENSMDCILDHEAFGEVLDRHVITRDFILALIRDAIVDNAEELGYEDIESSNQKYGSFVSESCKDNKTYSGRRNDGDGEGGSYGGSGGSYGGFHGGGGGASGWGVKKSFDFSPPAKG